MEVLRVCNVCGRKARTAEELNLFMRHKLGRYGRQNYCKPCHNEERKDYRKNRSIRPEIRKENRVRQKEYYENHREERLIYMKRYHDNNPEKRLARNKTKRIPIDQPCLLCGATENVERHHPDYEQPRVFLPICHACHMQIHHRNNRGLGE